MIDFKKAAEEARINKAKKLLGELGPKVKALQHPLSSLITGDQLHAEDVLMYYLYQDHVLQKPVIPWEELSALACDVEQRWPTSDVALAVIVGLHDMDFPGYIKEARRPTRLERMQHQTKIYKATLGTLY